MGITIGVMVLLVSGYLLAAALQQAAVIKPYVGAFAVAGLMAIAALAMDSQVGTLGDWVMMAAKLLAIFSCVAMCVHLALLVVRRLMAGGTPRS